MKMSTKTFIVMMDVYSEGYGCYIPEIMGVYTNTDINHVLKSFYRDMDGEKYYIKVVGDVGTPLLNAREDDNNSNHYFDYDIEGYNGVKEAKADLRNRFNLNCRMDEMSNDCIRIYPNVEELHPLVEQGKITQEEYNNLVKEIIKQG